jgi:hypothetical protein
VFTKSGGTKYTAEQLIEYYEGLLNTYPIISTADGYAERDWSGWNQLTRRLGGRIQLIGDDNFFPNTKFLRRGIEGYGRAGAIHRAKRFIVSGDLPITIVSTDEEEKILRVLPEIAAMLKDGMINLMDVDAIEVHKGQIV